MLEFILYILIICGVKELPPSISQRYDDEIIVSTLQKVQLGLDLTFDKKNRYEPYWITGITKYQLTLTLYNQVKNCPHSWEAYRFPGFQTNESVYDYERDVTTYRNRLMLYYQTQKQLQKHRRDYWDKMIQDLEYCKNVDETFRSTRILDCEWRRMFLRDLRNLIGNEAFYNGQLPPLIPVWNIPTIER